MLLKKIIFTCFVLLGMAFMPVVTSCLQAGQRPGYGITDNIRQIIPGAELTHLYFHLLKGKRVAVAGNHTSTVGRVHLVDTLLGAGINVVKVFGPEHGFRGTAPDGKHIATEKDPLTGLVIASLYGANRKPTKEQMADVDVVVFDMQDVGMRFYTYISTMTLIMQAAAEEDKKVMVLDRPNPHGHYIDGPSLDLAFTSFVGMHPVPVVYGMTIGEYAQMVNGEGWLGAGKKVALTVIPVANYTHSELYQLPIGPSPNLPNMQAIYLYGSLCFFEGTAISVGRGTEMPFQVFGHPDLPAEKYPLRFTPQSVQASTNPPLLGKECRGRDLRHIPVETLKTERRINLSYLLEAYRDFPQKENFFIRSTFDRLAGSTLLRNQIMAGLNEDQIRLSWQPAIEAFKKIRAKYLLYPDFE